MNTTALQSVSQGITATVPLPESAPGKKSTKKRVRNFSADDRAAHRIFERGRREAFKERLTELAGQLPVLADTDPERLSKHVVVNESIARHKLLENRCVDALRDIESLLRERDELLAEINVWRGNAGASSRLPKSISNIAGLMKTEDEMLSREAKGHHIREGNGSSEDKGSRGGQAQAAMAIETHPSEASHLSQLLKVDQTHDINPVPNLDELLRDTSWPQTTQTHLPVFPPEPPLASPDDIPIIPPTITRDSLPVATSEAADYRMFVDVNPTQQALLLNMDTIQFPAPDENSIELPNVLLRPHYLSRTSLDEEPLLEHSQQWVSWHG
ncbi:uncharacterized protein CLUP02_14518 [Colletotrichum lupini]|uniref:BHLH domain-containing protein n=1 Tax=Colletotrichum lupini TaxID=145971 RepID=A0A9Q8T6E7_9PEZI|nr:uncharacterized protein CLUP02_14518 [Colletotrichum lupini]UQC88991.1 hypothetical protein CLUP02_14518 [Colletotrichum lupini]